MSELIGQAQAGGSLKDTGFKHSVVGAIGMASASGKSSFQLGMELHRLRCSGQPERWPLALGRFKAQAWGYAKKRRWRKTDRALVERMCGHALGEWLFDLCLTCVGRGRIAIERYTPEGTKIEHVCPKCAGSGRQRPDVDARMKLVGCEVRDYVNLWEERFSDLIGILEKCYGVAQRAVARKLQRKVEDA